MVFCEGRALLGTSFVSLGWRAVIDRDRLVVLHDDVMVCAHGADGFDKVTWDHGGEAHLLGRLLSANHAIVTRDGGRVRLGMLLRVRCWMGEVEGEKLLGPLCHIRSQ